METRLPAFRESLSPAYIGYSGPSPAFSPANLGSLSQSKIPNLNPEGLPEWFKAVKSLLRERNKKLFYLFSQYQLKIILFYVWGVSLFAEIKSKPYGLC